MDVDSEVIQEVAGAGGDGAVRDEILDALKNEVDAIVSSSTYVGLWETRLEADETRFCVWDGQSSDGRKHAAENDDAPVEPFEGACDQRIRLADAITNEKVMLLLTAASRAQLAVRPVEGGDQKRAGNLTVLLRWVMRNMLGFEYVQEMAKLAQYYCGDTPAIALASVQWRREVALEMKRLTLKELMDLYVGMVLKQGGEAGSEEELQAQAQAAGQEFMDAFELGGDVEGLAALLQGLFGYLTPARARKVVEELRLKGWAEFPAPYVRRDGPVLKAKRFYEEWFISEAAAGFDDAWAYFEAEWLNKAQVKQRQIEEGWSREFVEELLGEGKGPGQGGHAGEAAFKEYRLRGDGTLTEVDEATYRDHYQVITARFQAVNADGVPGRYSIVFHRNVKVPATERRLSRDAHGKYPGVVLRREVLSRRLIDSRGIPELTGTHQDMLKLFVDSFGDNAQLSAVPPLLTRGRTGQTYIGPMVELHLRRDGDAKWMQPPTYPAVVPNMIQETRRQVDEYWGRTNELVAPETVQVRQEWEVTWWLAQLREVWRMVFALCQQYLPDEVIARVIGPTGEPMFRSREEIQGQFDLELTFDPRDLDPEYLKGMGEILRDVIIPLDRQQTIQTAPVVAAFLWRLAPDLAEKAIVPVEQADRSEAEDELRNMSMIRNGIEPPRVEDGSQNYPLRLGMYESATQANPAAFEDLPEDKRAILEARLQHLQSMAQQHGENKQIGREGARRALGGE